MIMLTVQPLYGCDPNQSSLQETAPNGGQYSTDSAKPNSYNICA
jgi:hypothetical protein